MRENVHADEHDDIHDNMYDDVQASRYVDNMIDLEKCRELSSIIDAAIDYERTVLARGERLEYDKRCSPPLWLGTQAQGSARVLAVLQEAMDAQAKNGRMPFSLKIVGQKATFGRYGPGPCPGLSAHYDHALQGGDYSFLVYLNDVPHEADGRIVFLDENTKRPKDSESYMNGIRPRAGRAILFSVDRDLHEARPLTLEGCFKYLVACEAVRMKEDESPPKNRINDQTL